MLSTHLSIHSFLGTSNCYFKATKILGLKSLQSSRDDTSGMNNGGMSRRGRGRCGKSPCPRVWGGKVADTQSDQERCRGDCVVERILTAGNGEGDIPQGGGEYEEKCGDDGNKS